MENLYKKFQKDLKFGIENEYFLIPIIEKEFDTKVIEKCDTNQYDLLLDDGRKIEIKTDTRIEEIEKLNMYIEYQCRGKDSGIKTSHADYWIIYFINMGFILKFRKRTLERLVELSKMDDVKFKYNVKGGDNKLSLGALFNVLDTVKIAGELIKIN